MENFNNTYPTPARTALSSNARDLARFTELVTPLTEDQITAAMARGAKAGDLQRNIIVALSFADANGYTVATTDIDAGIRAACITTVRESGGAARFGSVCTGAGWFS